MDKRSRRSRLRAGAASVAAALALAAAAWGATGIGIGGGAEEAGADTGDDLPPTTDTVRRETLADRESVAGTLGYGREWTLAARAGGTVTWTPEVGAVIKRGAPLAKVDDDPVILLHGDLPAYRNLTPGVEGKDVAQLERNLDKLGYDGFTVDDEYTSATAAAVEEWQDDLGLAETGRVELGRVVFARTDVRISATSAGSGDIVTPGGTLLSYTGTTRVITVTLEVEDQRLAVDGATVDVTMPDGASLDGRIETVETVIQPADEPDGDPTTEIEVEVAIDGKVEGFDAASVDVEFTASTRENVLTVPVAALLALAEGGYGLEVVEGGASRIVAVETGLFASGRVEVSGDGLAEGAAVGVPS